MSIAKRTIALLAGALACAHCSSSPDAARDSGVVVEADAEAAPDAQPAIDAGIGEPDAEPEVDAGDQRPIVPQFTAYTGMPETMPSLRWGAQMAFVPSERRFILFGGSQYPLGRTTGGTFSHSLEDGTWTELPATDPPPPRYCHNVLYLPDHHQVLLVGGRNDRGPLPWAAWTLDLATNAWTAVDGDVPQGVIGPTLAWMPNYPGGARAIVFGGATSSAVLDTTWAYDPDARIFERVTTSSVPPGRSDAVMTYDPEGGRVLLWGGVTRLFPTPNHLHDLWSFDGTDWRYIATEQSPRGRRSMGAAFDETHREWVLFSGTIEEGDLSDLWVLDAKTDRWTNYPIENAPAARGFFAFGYSPADEVFVGFGGLQAPLTQGLDDGFELRLRAP